MHELSQSGHAVEIERRLLAELDVLLAGQDELAAELIGLLAAARGPLSLRDLTDLVRLSNPVWSPSQVSRAIEQDVGRVLVPVHTGDALRFAFAHDAIAERVKTAYGGDLARYRKRLLDVIYVEQAAILGPDGTLLDNASDSRRELNTRIVEVSEELIALFVTEPELLYQLPPRRFEELVAELYRRRGFKTILTPASNDAGVDMFVFRHDEVGASMSVVQCKRYAPRRKVGPELIRELQGTVVGAGASAGILITTSFFTSGALELERRFPHQLSLQDYFALQELIRLPVLLTRPDRPLRAPRAAA